MKKNFIICLIIIIVLAFLYLNNDSKSFVSTMEASRILNMPIIVVENDNIRRSSPKVLLLINTEDQPYGYHTAYNYHLIESPKTLFVTIYGIKTKEDAIPSITSYKILESKTFNINNIKVEMSIMNDKENNKYQITYDFYLKNSKYRFTFSSSDFDNLKELENLTRALIIKSL